jgi:lysophospholipase L1-like esterase
VLGESTAVGVGVTDQHDGLGFRVAGELARRTEARVEWHVVGRTGATVAEVTSSLLHDLPGDLDLVVVVFGVNDTLQLRSRRAWRRQIGQLIDAVTPSVAAAGRIAILGVPDFATLPALPQPLRTILHWHALALDLELKHVVARRPGCVHVPAIPLPVGDYLSHDRFHPNAAAYRVWAAHIADTIA